MRERFYLLSFLTLLSLQIRGFQSLIEDEWISAGHPFSIRCAHAAFATGTLTGPHESPVFLCFLDSVWQVSSLFLQKIKIFRSLNSYFPN